MAQSINSASIPTNAAPITYDLKKVQEACAQSSIKAAFEIIKTFQSQGKEQTHMTLAKALLSRLTPLLEKKRTDEKVQKVYSVVFHATMANVENGLAEFLLLKLTKDTDKPKVEQARIKPNLEFVKAAGGDLVKLFVAAHVIPEAIALAEKLQKEQPTSFDVASLWQVAPTYVQKYKEYNLG